MTTVNAWTPSDLPSQQGKHFAITGANSGIGLQAARILAEKGAKISLLCRSKDKAEDAMQLIKQSAPEAELAFTPLNLMSLESIRQAANTLSQQSEKLDGFINNAGIMAVPQAETEDGFESQFGTNHLGHFALNGLLFEKFKTDGTRIVSVSSLAHRFGRLNFNNLNAEKRYQKWVVYGQAKLANLVYIRELQRRLDQAGIKLSATACHPGYSSTNLQQYGAKLAGKGLTDKMAGLANIIFAQSAEQGSWPTVFAAASDDAHAGRYYGPNGLFETRGKVKEAHVGSHALSIENAQKLWEKSEELTGVSWQF